MSVFKLATWNTSLIYSIPLNWLLTDLKLIHLTAIHFFCVCIFRACIQYRKIYHLCAVCTQKIIIIIIINNNNKTKLYSVKSILSHQECFYLLSTTKFFHFTYPRYLVVLMAVHMCEILVISMSFCLFCLHVLCIQFLSFRFSIRPS